MQHLGSLQNEQRVYANQVYLENMLVYGFSFTPKGIYEAGKGKRNWRLAMQSHQPTQREHPQLFIPARFANLTAASQLITKHKEKQNGKDSKKNTDV